MTCLTISGGEVRPARQLDPSSLKPLTYRRRFLRVIKAWIVAILSPWYAGDFLPTALLLEHVMHRQVAVPLKPQEIAQGEWMAMVQAGVCFS